MGSARSVFAEKYRQLCDMMERDTLDTQILIYGTSALMLLVAVTKRKPAYLIRPFKKPFHIPDILINERNIHTGLVKGIQQNGSDTLLLISHRPLITFFMNNKRLLQIKLPGVKVNGNGISWLQNCIVGREATFVPFNNRASDKYVSQLCLVPPSKGNRLLDISETLLKLRFARFEADIDATAKKNVKYYKHLANVELNTQSRNAMLANVSNYPWIGKALHDFKASILPKEKLLPELVR